MLEPESIRTPRTTAIDETWAERLALLRYNQLKIDFASETNSQKLELWLEMFGISADVLQQGLTTDEYRRLLQSVILIYRLSGTTKSIELLCKVLGANSAKVVYLYVLRYDGQARYDGQYLYDGGALFAQFAITVEVTGITIESLTTFKNKLRQLFGIFEPAWIYLEGVKIVEGDGLPYKLPFRLAKNPDVFPLLLPFKLK